MWAAKGFQEPSPCRHLRLSWVYLLPTHQMPRPCAPVFRKALPSVSTMAQATSPHTDHSNTPSVSLRHPSSPFARMVFTQHSPHLSLFSTQEHPPEDEGQAAQRGVRDSAQSGPPHATPVSSPPGPTRTPTRLQAQAGSCSPAPPHTPSSPAGPTPWAWLVSSLCPGALLLHPHSYPCQ